MQFYQSKIGLKYFFIIGVIGWGLNLVVNTMFSRMLGVEAFGDVSVALTLLTTFGTLFTLGLTDTIPSILPDIHRDNKKSQLNFFSWCNELMGITSIYTYLVCLGVLLLIYTNIIPFQQELYHIGFASLLIAPIYAFYLLINSFLSVTGKEHWSQLIQLVFFPLFLLGIFMGSLWLTNHDLQSIPWILALTAVFVLILTIGFFIYFQPSVISQIKLRQTSLEQQAWNKTTYNFIASSIYELVINNSPILLLEWLGKSESEVGVYSALLTLPSILTIIQNIVYYGVLQPKSQLLLHTNKPQLQKLIDSSNRQVYFFCVVTAVIIFGLSDYTLGLFGTEFVNYWPLLGLLLASKLIDLSNDVSWVLCSLFDEGRTYVKKLYRNLCIFNLVSYGLACYFFGLTALLLAQILYKVLLSSALIFKAKRLTQLRVWFIF